MGTAPSICDVRGLRRLADPEGLRQQLGDQAEHVAGQIKLAAQRPTVERPENLAAYLEGLRIAAMRLRSALDLEGRNNG